MTKFWTIWPLSSRGQAGVKWGSNFQNASNDLSYILNYSWGYKITKIYSLLCVGCMVREILTKGHPKVKRGQIFNNIRFAWMIYPIIPLSLHIPKKNILLSYLSFHFWNKPICLNSDHDCSGRSTQVQNGDYWLQEIDNPHKAVNRLNWFCLAYAYSHQVWI